MCISYYWLYDTCPALLIGKSHNLLIAKARACRLTSVPQGEDMLDFGESSSSALSLLARGFDKVVTAFADVDAPAEGGLPWAACRFSSAISASFSAMILFMWFVSACVSRISSSCFLHSSAQHALLQRNSCFLCAPLPLSCADSSFTLQSKLQTGNIRARR